MINGERKLFTSVNFGGKSTEACVTTENNFFANQIPMEIFRSNKFTSVQISAEK
jgi:hypothetical protein